MSAKFVSYLRTYTDLLQNNIRLIDRLKTTVLVKCVVFIMRQTLYSQRWLARMLLVPICALLLPDLLFTTLTQGGSCTDQHENRLRGRYERRRCGCKDEKKPGFTLHTYKKVLFDHQNTIRRNCIRDTSWENCKIWHLFRWWYMISLRHRAFMGRYYDNINKGMNETEAIREADR